MILLRNKKCSVCCEYKSKLIRCGCGSIVCRTCASLHECKGCIGEKEVKRIMESYPHDENGLKWIEKVNA